MDRQIGRCGHHAVHASTIAFLEYLRLNRNASAHTVSAYDSDLSQFLAFAAAQRSASRAAARADELRSRRRPRVHGRLHRQGQARSSVARKLSALRAFGRYLRREGWIRSIRRRLRSRQSASSRVPAHLSVDEMTRLLEMPDATEPLGRRDRAILELFYASGLRLSELVGLDVEDVNLPARMVRVIGKGGEGAAGAVQRHDRGVAARVAGDRTRCERSRRGRDRPGRQRPDRGHGEAAAATEPRAASRCSSTFAALG